MKKKSLIICFILVLAVFSCSKKEHKPLDLTIIHMNDTHSYVDPVPLKINLGGNTYRVKSGGYSYAANAVREIKKDAVNPILLHAGDAMTGTFYYASFKWKPDAAALNNLEWDAFTIGNHEFDDGNKVLADFLKEVKVPIVAANIKTTDDSPLKDLWEPYIIKEVDGEEVAIIGMNRVAKTLASSNPDDDAIFKDEVKTINKISKKLTKKGINKIIVLAHSGHPDSIEFCKELKNIDIFVDGDSHSLLGRDFDELGLKSEDEYPTLVNSASNTPTYIVQAWEYNKIVGVLKVSFSKDGIITNVEDESKLIINTDVKDNNKKILDDDEFKYFYSLAKGTNRIMIATEDEKMSKALEPYTSKLKEELAKKIGFVSSDVPGGSKLRVPTPQNPFGHFTAKLVAEGYLHTLKQFGDRKTSIVIQNAGGVRTSLSKGAVSLQDVYNMLPFANTICLFELSGKEVKEVLEDALDSAFREGGSNGSFPYCGGINFKVAKNNNRGERVSDIKFNDGTPLDMEKTYTVGTNSYIADGKDGYDTFGKVKRERGVNDTFIDYAKAFSDYVIDLKTIEKPKDTGVFVTF